MRSRQSLFAKFIRSTQINSCSFELFHFYFISERFEILNTKVAVFFFVFFFVFLFLFLAVSIKFRLGKKKIVDLIM